MSVSSRLPTAPAPALQLTACFEPLIIVSFVCFVTTGGDRKRAREAHAKLRHASGDALSALNALCAYLAVPPSTADAFCRCVAVLTQLEFAKPNNGRIRAVRLR